ncbi:hypothetical protein HYH03_011110 [Edaphochlamys debaryana]|uniref:Large ribosomal subunit protein uL23c n=1 Tax=Edaphochlamys debaryana TaxID=47281 RepID=A0A836BVB9_9CHLO|nr:hypothetical protein HYH03_011110 [Edaphochlamys debaryana]|eukprot:KAG2490481.1 hypothetical protein HYH03_011110 [Edaphochlamys debaryana]
MSSELRARPGPPERRIPICFPNMTLQMLKLPEDQLKFLRRTGWLREVAFRTTPDVTKLEIAAFLESVYGMTVERVSTINYLGRKRLTIARRGKRLWWREDDWKKAYVIFRPPAGQEHLMDEHRELYGSVRQGSEEDGEEEGGSGSELERIRRAVRAPKLAPKVWPWERAGLRGAGLGKAGPGGAEGAVVSAAVPALEAGTAKVEEKSEAPAKAEGEAPRVEPAKEEGAKAGEGSNKA